jgi:hypothetical protein
VIDEHAAHHARGHREEVRAVLPAHAAQLHKAEVRLVDESGGLQGVSRPLAVHLAAGEALEFFVHDGKQPLERGRVAAPQATRSSVIDASAEEPTVPTDSSIGG